MKMVLTNGTLSQDSGVLETNMVPTHTRLAPWSGDSTLWRFEPGSSSAEPNVLVSSFQVMWTLIHLMNHRVHLYS